MEETKMNEITALDLLKAYRALPREKQITYLAYLSALKERGVL